MAIQLRRGAYENYDASKLKPAEVGVVQSGDPNTTDGKAVYIAINTNDVKRIPTADEMVDHNAEAEGIYNNIVAQNQTASQLFQNTSTKAAEAEQSASTASSASASANSSMQRAETAANLLTNVTATAQTLEAGQQATANYSNGVFSFGIPKGDTGNTGAIKSMIAGVESSTVATKNYSIGDLVIVGDTLCEVTAAIASGETISVSKARVTTVDDTIKNRIVAIDNVIENRIADSIDATLTQSGQAADAKVVGDEIEGVKSEVDYNYIKYETGTNLFDIDNTEALFSGIYVSSISGKKLSNSDKSAFIVPIDASKGTLSINSQWVHIVFLSAYTDISNVVEGFVIDNFISGVSGSSSACENVSIPSGATYVVVSMDNSRLSTAQLQYGAECTPYEPFEHFLNVDAVKNNSLPINKIKDLHETLENEFVPYVAGTNLFNKDDSDNLCEGYYVSYSNGIKHANESMTMFIVPIDAEEGKLSLNSTWANIAFTSEYVQLSNAGVEVAVNGYISGVAGSSSPHEGFTIPSNAKYVIVSITTSQIATAQLQYGETCTAYEHYKNVIDGQEIKKGSIQIDAIERTSYTVDINGNGDYMSLLEALKNTPNNTKIHVRQGTYNILDEYTSFYGSDFWDNYDSYNNHSDDNFYRGYWISDGRVIDCDANALFTFDYTGSNTNVKAYFSPFALGKQATLKGVNILYTNTCRYAVHDDFAGYISGTPEGVNIIENCVFDGGATAIGGGCGRSNTYIINNCIFLNGISDTNIFYHNNVNAGAKNKIFVSNCYGNKGLEFRWYGKSTKISECMTSSCSFTHISCLANSSGVTTNENMVLYKINCTETDLVS